MKKNWKWKIWLTLALVIVLFDSNLACGVPQTIYGSATMSDGVTPVSGAIVQIQATGGGEAQSTKTNQAGLFQFNPATACLEYQISIGHSSIVFVNPVRIFYVAGDAEGYEINFIRAKWKPPYL